WMSAATAVVGIFSEVQFSAPEMVNGAALTSHWVYPRLDIYGRGVDGKWALLADNATSEPPPKEDLLKAALLDLKRNGFGYILAPRTGGNGDLGKYLINRAASGYGMIDMGGVHEIRLLRL